ncbi:unnamed protein product [Danaus chrysippus]|uniref:(African queen) hypothetical protein n=1 Tax=Danaus chrysippus TaxID=151541 RepID=A0A8J2QTV7_9NEOP|nr:unnamed protein product [Danaus chrysippus]
MPAVTSTLGFTPSAFGDAAAWGECPPAVRALFEPKRPAARAPPLTRYAAPDGTILLLTENGTRLMTRAAAASLLRAALLSPRPPRPRHGEPLPHLSLYVSIGFRRLSHCTLRYASLTIGQSGKTRHFANESRCVARSEIKLISDGRTANRNTTAVTSWIGGMSITQDGNLITPDKLMTHVHRYASPHYRPHGHHYHHWNHEPGGSEDPLYATKTVYGPGYIDENHEPARHCLHGGFLIIALPESSFIHSLRLDHFNPSNTSRSFNTGFLRLVDINTLKIK